MVKIFQYDRIIKYHITATCTEPLHIGNTDGEKGQVLVHPADGIPFVQATSISGVFQAYYRKAFGPAETDLLFGKRNLDEENQDESSEGSRIRISDGFFCSKGTALKMELRPRVKINPRTGTCDSVDVQGSNRKSGQKFNMEYIGAGAKIQFSVYLYDANKKEMLEDIFRAIQQQQIQFGGQKSNGCGYLEIDRILYKEFNMKQQQDRELWMREDDLEECGYEDYTVKFSRETAIDAYRITVTGRTEGELIVKSIAVADCGEDAPDCMNIQNAKKDYIVPGSSFKGAVRSQMELIASYLGNQEIISDSFGIPEGKSQKGKNGNIRFFDTVIGEKKKNDQNSIRHRIHIDKFTGGVMHSGLFSEKNAFGNVKFRIEILNRNYPERTCGLLLLALRDMAVGMVNVGGGRNVGKGFIAIETIMIESKDGTWAEITFPDKKINDGSRIIQRCLNAVRRERG